MRRFRAWTEGSGAGGDPPAGRCRGPWPCGCPGCPSGARAAPLRRRPSRPRPGGRASPFRGSESRPGAAGDGVAGRSGRPRAAGRVPGVRDPSWASRRPLGSRRCSRRCSPLALRSCSGVASPAFSNWSWSDPTISAAPRRRGRLEPPVTARRSDSPASPARPRSRRIACGRNDGHRESSVGGAGCQPEIGPCFVGKTPERAGCFRHLGTLDSARVGVREPSPASRNANLGPGGSSRRGVRPTDRRLATAGSGAPPALVQMPAMVRAGKMPAFPGRRGTGPRFPDPAPSWSPETEWCGPLSAKAPGYGNNLSRPMGRRFPGSPGVWVLSCPPCPGSNACDGLCGQDARVPRTRSSKTSISWLHPLMEAGSAAQAPRS